jgi:hypothetical protein
MGLAFFNTGAMLAVIVAFQGHSRTEGSHLEINSRYFECNMPAAEKKKHSNPPSPLTLLQKVPSSFRQRQNTSPGTSISWPLYAKAVSFSLKASSRNRQR